MVCISMLYYDPNHRFEDRNRHTQSDRTLDVILLFELAALRKMATAERPLFFANRLLTDLPSMIAKYKFVDFDLPKFETKFWTYFKELGWT